MRARFFLFPDRNTLGLMRNYLGASVLGTAVHYALLILLVTYAGFDAALATVVGAIAGALIIYFSGYYLVFASDRGHRSAFVRFFLVAVLGAILNGVILKLLTLLFAVNYLFLQVVTTGLVFFCNFALNRCWTFARVAKPDAGTIGASETPDRDPVRLDATGRCVADFSDE